MAKLNDDEFERLKWAVMQAESRGNPNAVSRAGAVGTMQTMPGTLRDPGFGVRPARDDSAAERERVGVDYLRAMVDRHATVPEALAAYNWGPGSLAKGGLAAAPPETRAYIPKVMKMAGFAPSFQADVRKADTIASTPGVGALVHADFPLAPNEPTRIAQTAVPPGALVNAAPAVDTFTPPTPPIALAASTRVKPTVPVIAQQQTMIDRERAGAMPDLVALFEAIRKRSLSV